MVRRILIALAMLATSATLEARTMKVPDDVTAAITAIIDGETAAWNRGDAAAFAAVTTDDVVFTNIIGMFTVGRAPFEAQHARIFATIYHSSTMRQTIEHIALVRPDVAIVDTLTGVSGFAALPPGVDAADGALHTRLEQVMVRDGTTWRVAAFHNVVVNARALAAIPK